MLQFLFKSFQSANPLPHFYHFFHFHICQTQIIPYELEIATFCQLIFLQMFHDLTSY